MIMMIKGIIRQAGPSIWFKNWDVGLGLLIKLV